jgi:CheY-like chemotaxis protein
MAAILIVEDDLLICELAELIIQDWGHHTYSANDIEGALPIIRSGVPIDLLFTDIRLKSAIFGGCDLAHQAIAFRPLLRVLYTTGSAITNELTVRFVEGAQWLRKPYFEPQLMFSIGNALSARL